MIMLNSSHVTNRLWQVWNEVAGKHRDVAAECKGMTSQLYVYVRMIASKSRAPRFMNNTRSRLPRQSGADVQTGANGKRSRGARG